MDRIDGTAQTAICPVANRSYTFLANTLAVRGRHWTAFTDFTDHPLDHQLSRDQFLPFRARRLGRYQPLQQTSLRPIGQIGPLLAETGTRERILDDLFEGFSKGKAGQLLAGPFPRG